MQWFLTLRRNKYIYIGYNYRVLYLLSKIEIKDDFGFSTEKRNRLPCREKHLRLEENQRIVR